MPGSSLFLTKRKIWAFALIALLAAGVITLQTRPSSYDETLVRIQTEHHLGYLGDAVLKQPALIQAQLISYSNNRLLTQQAWLALLKYPQQTPKILDWYGEDAEFQAILKRFGPEIVPVIDYFNTHSMPQISAIKTLSRAADTIAQRSQSLWHSLIGFHSAHQSTTTPPGDAAELTAKQRGRIGIEYIRHEGNHFLGQFDVDKDGHAHWNTTDRITQDLGQLLTSGMVNAERKSNLGQKLTSADYGWAAVDALPFIAEFKLLKFGKAGVDAAKYTKAVKAISTGKTGKLATKESQAAKAVWIERSGILARDLAPGILRKTAWLATGYIVITHHELLSSLFVQMGRIFGAPAWLSMLLGWTSVFYFLLFPFIWLFEKLIRYLALGLRWLSMGQRKL